MTQSSTYSGISKVMVGNSTSTLISPICFTQIPHHTNPLVMSEVLYAPNITKNLLFVFNLLRVIMCILCVYSPGCFVKDLQTQHLVLLEGHEYGGLYKMHLPNVSRGASTPPIKNHRTIVKEIE